ncbi:MAG: respiratory nitrate reductase subunit gamma [Desulfobacteraceae bacterium]
METLYYIVLVPMVYAAFGIFILGTIYKLIRTFRSPKHPSTLQVFPERKPRWLWALHDTLLLPTVRRHNPVHWVFLMVFHLAFLLVILGHIELFAEIPLFQVIEHEVFIGKGFVGLTLSVVLLFFLFRRFHSPYRELSVPEDYYLLILLFLTVLFGSEMDWARRWYDYDGLMVGDYRDYLLSLVHFKPDISFVSYGGHAFMLVVHIFFANLFLMVFPFTKIMHSFFSLAMNKLRRG